MPCGPVGTICQPVPVNEDKIIVHGEVFDSLILEFERTRHSEYELRQQLNNSNSQLVLARNTENSLARVQSEYYSLQSRNTNLESEKSNLQNLINAGQRELNTKNNQIATYSTQLT